MYLVIRCNACGRFIYAKESQKTRACPCGQKMLVSKMRIYACVDDERKAGDAVRFFQEKEFGVPHFKTY